MSIEDYFPKLQRSRYCITSPASIDYNCIAWAAGQQDVWWWPDSMGVGYWPAGVLREETIEAFVLAFQSLGYAVCDSDELELGFEKVAIYAIAEDVPTHAARQLSNGKWTSKLGE
jgi:hypothetical protein